MVHLFRAQFLLIFILASAVGGSSFAQESIDEMSLDESEMNSLEEPSKAISEAQLPVVEETPIVEPTLEASSETVDIDLPEVKVEEEAVTTSPVTEEVSEVKEEVATSSDDLESLKVDAGEVDFKLPEIDTAKAEEQPTEKEEVKKEESATAASGMDIFDVGREEKELLELAQNVTGQISDKEWNELSTAAQTSNYTVVKNDWLFKISKKLFGSGFYYPKIWSLNSYITNPHMIEPGMVLSFTTGSGSRSPEVKLGTFTEEELKAAPGTGYGGDSKDLASFGESTRPEWLDKKQNLKEQGVYFQYATEQTMDDLEKVNQQVLNREYESYTPPMKDFEVVVPSNYDQVTGFDKDSKIFYSFKQGFFLNTFLSTNIVQDFGKITDGPNENIFFRNHDRAYVVFDESMNVLPGDKFSIYTAAGKAKHKNSDREGYKFAIIGQIKTIQKIENKWEIEFLEVSGTPQRGDRVTVYTPKIEKITQTYSNRIIEAAIMASYNPDQLMMGYGDVVYIDRGRADGVELGNVFEVYGFKDRSTNKNITNQPTYKTGELTIITLTDNFATAIVSSAIKDFYTGDAAITKTKASQLRAQMAKSAEKDAAKATANGRDLEELDIELNLNDLNDDLLKQADKMKLSEDELAELERQEREKSFMKDSEKDLKSLERLENELQEAEQILNDAKLDEDKLLEVSDLEDMEKKQGLAEQDSINEIEENLGKRYMDENLNSKDNPYGLNDFDVEEVDELLNIEKDGQSK